eukprot:12882357-Prorocentrum_lima.AAC.1
MRLYLGASTEQASLPGMRSLQLERKRDLPVGRQQLVAGSTSRATHYSSMLDSSMNAGCWSLCHPRRRPATKRL